MKPTNPRILTINDGVRIQRAIFETEEITEH